jgi:WD40 repeat protein
VAWSPNGKRLLTGSGDNTAKVWDGTTGKELLTLGGHNRELLSVAWNPNGKQLATASEDATVQVFVIDRMVGEHPAGAAHHHLGTRRRMGYMAER